MLDSGLNILNRKTEMSQTINLQMILKATGNKVNPWDKPETILAKTTHLNLQDKHINQIDNLHLCKNLKVLYLYDNDIELIENLVVCPFLTNLFLQNNKIRIIDNLNCNVELKVINLDSNYISRLEGLTYQNKLEQLSLSNQHLPPSVYFSYDTETLNTLATCLLSLDISNSHVKYISPLGCLYYLDNFKALHNQIDEIEDVTSFICSTRATSIDIRENPVNDIPKSWDYMIISSSPRLSYLNDKEVLATQKEFLIRLYQRKTKPKSTRPKQPTSQIPSAPQVKRTEFKNPKVPRPKPMAKSFDGMGISGLSISGGKV